jgi:hypothetical protein
LRKREKSNPREKKIVFIPPFLATEILRAYPKATDSGKFSPVLKPVFA